METNKDKEVIEFKINGSSANHSAIIDHDKYKVQFLMRDGMTIKFFRLHENRWYKVREKSWTYFELNAAISWAKNYIDTMQGFLQDKLDKQLANHQPQK